MSTPLRVITHGLLLAGAVACGSEKQAAPSPSGVDAAQGERVFQSPLSDGNSFTCATCHALHEPTEDGLLRPGHPIGDATRRTAWKNGKAKTFLDAANSCVTEWMVATPWVDDDPEYQALYRYLDSQASVARASNVSFEIVQPPADVSGGSAERGRALFDQSCVVCHGSGGLGTVRGPRVANSKRTPDYVAARIRTSGSATSSVYEGLTGGVMPFWAKDRLSDGEVRDLVAFVTSEPSSSAGGSGASAGAGNASGSGGAAGAGDGGANPASGGEAGRDPGAGGASSNVGNGGNAGNGGIVGNVSGCTKTNPRVGYTANLGVNTGEGQVSGFVTMVDDCTLELHDFSYDGNGIDVRVYGSKNQNFKPGFSIGQDLVGKTFVRQTLRVKLPDGKTLDSLDWVSIWCVAASANFGSGPFLPP